MRLLLRTLFTVVTMMAIALCIGFFMYVRVLETYTPDKQAKADGIVVLTGGSQRIVDAATLLAEGRAQRMLITGVNEATTRQEIALAHPVIAGCCVDLDYRALNTVGNAIETRRWAESNNFHSLLVVTSTYHMPRTLLELQHALPEVRLLPYPVIAAQSDGGRWLTDGEALRFLVWEYIKFVAALTRTTLETDPEHSPFAILFGGRKPLS